MNTIRVALTTISKNMKTGPIPVSTSGKSSCPKICPMRNNGCYADHGALNIHWNRLEKKTDNGYTWGVDWNTFCDQVSGLPSGSVWRHNQAGDLPQIDGTIDAVKLGQLVKANQGKRGFTYTHKPTTKENNQIIKRANKFGFTINLSGNNIQHADYLKSLNIAPVVCILPADTAVKVQTSPAGHKIVTCPATYRDDATCSNCGLCQHADRDYIIGFPAHGQDKKKAESL